MQESVCKTGIERCRGYSLITSNKLNKNDVFQVIAYRPEPGTDSWALSTEKKLKQERTTRLVEMFQKNVMF